MHLRSLDVVASETMNDHVGHDTEHGTAKMAKVPKAAAGLRCLSLSRGVRLMHRIRAGAPESRVERELALSRTHRP